MHYFETHFKKLSGVGHFHSPDPSPLGKGTPLPMPHLLGAFGTSIPLAFCAWVTPFENPIATPLVVRPHVKSMCLIMSEVTGLVTLVSSVYGRPSNY